MMYKQLAVTALTAVFLLSSSESTCQTSTPASSARTNPAKNEAFFTEYSRLSSIPSLSSSPQIKKAGILKLSGSVRAHSASGFDPSLRNATMERLAGNAKLVVVAHPIATASSLTADQTFVFTNYRFVIDKIVKDASGRFHTDENIMVARAGGSTTVDGVRIEASDPDFPPFVLGQKYLLFLYSLPSGAFKATADASYQLSAEDSKVLRNSATDMPKSENDLLSDATDAVDVTAKR